MIKRRRLGQHFLNSRNIANVIVSEANISQDATVYEIGTGLGIITELLCGQANKVISVDADEIILEQAKRHLSHIKNLTLLSGDGFAERCKFSIFVSCLPYSKSRHAVEWLAQTPFSHGVIVVQEEFATKLLSKAAQRRAIGVIANYTLEITHVAKINRRNFDPPPKVNSVLLKIRQKRIISRQLISSINGIFAYRRKTIKNILKQFKREAIMDRRLDDLSDEEIVSLAMEIS